MLYRHTKFRFIHYFENYKSSDTKTTLTCKLTSYFQEILTRIVYKLALPNNHKDLSIEAPSIFHPTNLLSDVLVHTYYKLHI